MIENHMAAICERIKYSTDRDHALADVLKHVKDELTTQLMKNWLRGSSTSQLSNAVDHNQREATSRMVERITAWIDWLAAEDTL